MLASPFWLELHNYGPQPLALDGFILASSSGAQFVFPSQPSPVVAAGGFSVIDRTQLGFAPVDGEKLFLYSPGGKTIVNGIVAKNRHQVRPPGQPEANFQYPHDPADHSPGAPNRLTLEDGVVINEIMYHHRPTYANRGTPDRPRPRFSSHRPPSGNTTSAGSTSAPAGGPVSTTTALGLPAPRHLGSRRRAACSRSHSEPTFSRATDNGPTISANRSSTPPGRSRRFPSRFGSMTPAPSTSTAPRSSRAKTSRPPARSSTTRRQSPASRPLPM